MKPGHPALAAGNATLDLQKSRRRGSPTGGESLFKSSALVKMGQEGLELGLELGVYLAIH
jgi:hypothetical protein